MNKIIKNALLLMAITLVSGLLLGLVYEVTKGPIADSVQQAKEDAYKAVFPEAEEFTEFDNAETVLQDGNTYLQENGFADDTIEECYQVMAGGKVAGMVMNLTSSAGYGGDINFSMGIALDGTVKGIEILTIDETAGLGMRAKDGEFKDQFKDKKVESFNLTKTGAAAENDIDAISGATITSTAMTNAVNAGIAFYQSLTEGGILHE